MNVNECPTLAPLPHACGVPCLEARVGLVHWPLVLPVVVLPEVCSVK